MEDVKIIRKHEDGISFIGRNSKGHIMIESPYRNVQPTNSNAAVMGPYGGFIGKLAIYDATRNNINKFQMLVDFYEALSQVKSEQELAEMKTVLDQLNSLGGVMNQLYPMLSANLNMGAIANAQMYVGVYTKAYKAEEAKVKEQQAAKQQAEKQQTEQQDEDAKQDIGSRDINNVADKTARTVENAKGVDSALKVEYSLHVPDKATDDMFVYMKKIVAILNKYEENKNEVYLEEFKRTAFSAIDDLKKQEEFEAFNEFMEDLARQGDSGKEFYKQYQVLASEYEDKFRAKASNEEEFDQKYKQVMAEFEEFQEAKISGRSNPVDLEDLITKISHLMFETEDMQNTLSSSKYLKCSERIEECLNYLHKVRDQVEEYNSRYKRVMSEFEYSYNSRNINSREVEDLLNELTRLKYQTEEMQGSLSRAQYNKHVEAIQQRISYLRGVQEKLEEMDRLMRNL